MNEERIFQSLDKISGDISDLKVVVGKQEENIKEHMRRTEIAEENLALIREEIEPLKNHVVVINGVLKITGIIAIIIGAAASVFKIIETFINIVK